MEHVLDWGVDVILWLQHFSPTLDIPFRALTFLGEEGFFMLFLPLLYWCVDHRLGARLTVAFLFSSQLNAIAKLLAAQPRPFDYDARVKKLADVRGGGLPSGHTQDAVVVWGYLMAVVRRPWMWVLGLVLIVLVPLSRLYLGVHFPTDLLGGYVLGVPLLVAFVRFEPVVEEWLKRRRLGWQLVCAAAPGLLLLLPGCADDYAATASGALVGMAAGFVAQRRLVGFESGGPLWERVARYPVGGALLLGTRALLNASMAGLGGALWLVFMKYAALGVAAALVAPWLFVAVGLASGRRR